MKFSQFFSRWVHKNYYANGANIGKKGDFYTSVSVGWLFGAAWANYFLRCLDDGEFSQDTAIIEIGANDGSMMADFIQGIFTLRPEILNRLNFIIIEPHENLRQIQRKTFAMRFTNEIKITHFSNLSECKINQAFVMSNELVDSFACEVIDGQNMLFVDENFKFSWQKASDEILEICAKNGLKKGELALGIGKFARDLAGIAKRVKFCTFDYGQWGWRGDFSLRIYEKHGVKPFFEAKNLNELFGVSDMTYDVCFENLACEFKSAGLKMQKFCKQNTALIERFKVDEILNLLQKRANEQVYKNALKQLNFLTNPHFLGERFKFIEFTNF